ncbi:MAG: IS982 family transposase [Sphingobacteriales bacterium]|nr:IS982 family transposase [Sphingobacteriales bacterium]
MVDDTNNFQFYRNPPKMNDCEIISLAVCAEALSIDSENSFWKKLKTEYYNDFPNLIDRSNYNKRRRRLQHFIQQLNEKIAHHFSAFENVFIVDSIPIPICQLAREKRSKICKQHFETAPDKGYSAVSKSHYYGYKLHVSTTLNGTFMSMNISKASVHDVHFLETIKHSGMNHAMLIGDKGYLSKTHQLDLFETCKIELKTPMRTNQQNYQKYPFIFRKCRKRIETLFSQLCDQFLLKRNYAKSFDGLITRIKSKLCAVTVLQFINKSNNKSINHLKFALA